MNIQYEIAKMVTKNQISDEDIDKELGLLSQEEWDNQCAILDKMMKAHVKENFVNHKDKSTEEIILQDMINVSAANNVSETTFWIAYLKWLV